MQKLALTILGSLIGAGVGALAAMTLRAGSIGPVLAVTGGCLWACYGYCIATSAKRLERRGSRTSRPGGKVPGACADCFPT